MAVNNAIRIMLAYSARKNIENVMLEYSTWKPATISDSPSATSNGALFVSATPETGDKVHNIEREQWNDIPAQDAEIASLSINNLHQV